jgi:hypothetical protein
VHCLPPNREEFEKADTWAGMIALATEVGAKKFSSEEETFSDLSILIFDNNFRVRCTTAVSLAPHWRRRLRALL